MRFEVSSVLPASRPIVWGFMRRSETLRFIAQPKITFEGDLPKFWRSYQVYQVLVHREGAQEPSEYTFMFTKVDKEKGEMCTFECGGFIESWKHTMKVESLTDSTCRYTDIVDIHAGWRTPFVWWWAKYIYYPHRHKRWLELLKLKPATSQGNGQ